MKVQFFMITVSTALEPTARYVMGFETVAQLTRHMFRSLDSRSFKFSGLAQTAAAARRLWAGESVCEALYNRETTFLAAEAMEYLEHEGGFMKK